MSTPGVPLTLAEAEESLRGIVENEPTQRVALKPEPRSTSSAENGKYTVKELRFIFIKRFILTVSYGPIFFNVFISFYPI